MVQQAGDERMGKEEVKRGRRERTELEDELETGLDV